MTRFLIMVVEGVIILICALTPLSFDDGGAFASLNDTKRVTSRCMAIPWLAFTGFAMTFSALFSKTWRVNRLFHDTVRHARMQIKVEDVIAPFAVVLTGNIIVLICWTVIDPLTYSREEHDGTDYWNRVISTYGTCRSENVAAYLIPLAVINFAVVCIAVWQAYRARDIQSEFAETKYIGLALSSIAQGFLTGVPILVIVKDEPPAFYVVLTLMLFLLCMAVLLLIFLPKYFMRKKYVGLTEAEQRRILQQGIRKSSGVAEHGRDSRSGHADGSNNFMVSSDLNQLSTPFGMKNLILSEVPEKESVLSDDREALHERVSANDLVVSTARNGLSTITMDSNSLECFAGDVGASMKDSDLKRR
jgi:hypothetical protein